MARETIHKTTNYYPKALVYFLDKKWSNAKNPRGARIIVPDVEDITNISISRGTLGVIGTFNITINNENNKYFIADDVEKEIENLNTPASYDDIPEARGGETLKDYLREREKYPWGTVSEFLDQKVVKRRYSPPGSVEEFILEYNEDKGKWGYWDIPDSEFTDKEGAFATTSSVDDVTNHFKILDDDAQKDLEDSAARNSDFYTMYGGDLTKSRCLFEPMQRCIILLSKRVTDPQKDNHDMVTVFTGLVSTVTDTYQENLYQITVSGEDLTKWLRITLLNTNPALLTEALPESGDFLIYEHRFANMEGWEIIKTLVLGDYFDKTPKEIDAAKKAGKLLVRGVGQYEYRLMTDPTVSVLSNNVNFHEAIADGIVVTEEEFPKHRNKKTIEGLLFNEDTLHLQVFQGVVLRKDKDGSFITSPYKVFFRQSANTFVNEYKTHWELLKMVAEFTNFEFYADGTGDLWYHQPRFNNHHILSHKTPEVYIIRDEDLISADLSESDEEVVTSVIATGMQDVINVNGVQPIFDMINFYEDIGLVRKYGRRLFIINHPYIRTKEDCFLFAKSLLYRINAERFTGSITITGRAEIQPAMPVYVAARNMIYYIKQVEHKFEFGGQFTTTLQVTYGHKPWEVLQEVLDYRITPSMTAADKLKQFGKTIKYFPALRRNGETPQIIGKSDTIYAIRASGKVQATIPGNISVAGATITITGTGDYEGVTVTYVGVQPTKEAKKISKVSAGQTIGSLGAGLAGTDSEILKKLSEEEKQAITPTFYYQVDLQGTPIELNKIHSPKFDVQLRKNA